MSGEDGEFSLAQAMAAQRALRQTLGLGEERFPLPAFVGMISDEIERMRAAGHDDADIAAIVAEATGVAIDPAELARHYASSEERH